ncbi:MAG: dethiobiotin synthase [Rhizobiales bacterium]|nr:dethiobiotin synthase [Hyphomicrobiales bacterium]
MTAIFVTSTGTDIGKTFVTAGLIRHLRASGRIVEALKPVVTGFDPTTAANSDPGVLLTALGRPASLEEIAKISPWRYRAALSPDMAARREGSAVDFAQLGKFSLRAILTRRDVLFVEGVGGVMAPLDAEHTVLDWMVIMRLPLILVAGSYLGTISHTLTALDALMRRELTVLTVVVNETEGSAVPLDDTVDSIRRFVHPINVLPVPRMAGGADSAALAEALGGGRRGRSNSATAVSSDVRFRSA